MNFDRIDFVKYRKWYFLVSAVIIAAGLLVMAFAGFNAGVDFKSGTSLDINVESGNLTSQQALELIQAGRPEGSPPTITIGGDNANRVSARFDEVLDEDTRNRILEQFAQAFGEEEISYEESTVDTQIAREFAQRAAVVLLIASIGIVVYIMIRFEWRFALAAAITVFHDALFVLSIFAIFRFEFNLTIIAAILTVVGYSVNDTIVLFDRMRENLQKIKLKTYEDLAHLVNLSIRQTLTRAINTGLTIVIPAVLLMLIGSEGIRNFSIAMVIGLIAAAYSSIFMAAQLWLVFKKNSMNASKQSAAN